MWKTAGNLTVKWKSGEAAALRVSRVVPCPSREHFRLVQMLEMLRDFDENKVSSRRGDERLQLWHDEM